MRNLARRKGTPMKIAKPILICLLALAGLCGGVFSAHADTNDPPCDNCDPPECDPTKECCDEDSDGANRFGVFCDLDQKV